MAPQSRKRRPGHDKAEAEQWMLPLRSFFLRTYIPSGLSKTSGNIAPITTRRIVCRIYRVARSLRGDGAALYIALSPLAGPPCSEAENH